MNLNAAELLALPDDELSKHGFKKNNQGGITRITPRRRLKKKKSLGLKEFVKGIASENVTDACKKIRLQICKVCPEKDSEGNLLYREINEKPFCGKPRRQKILRDNTVDGCGCDLDFKAQKVDTTCPLGRWPDPTYIMNNKEIKVNGNHNLIISRPCSKCRKPRFKGP